jgi:dephospho-CoA kinase
MGAGVTGSSPSKDLAKPPYGAAFCFLDMKRIGITGGIGSGKSTGASYLMESGFPVLDTDDVARSVVAPGSEGLSEIVAEFGQGILARDGSLDRAAVAGIIFSDLNARGRLEALLHPRIQRVWTGFLSARERDCALAAFVVIPLLFEKSYQAQFDAVIAVGCSSATQWRRLEGRGWAPDAIRSRLSAQWTTEAKMASADHVVWNEGTLAVQRIQWDRILDHLLPGLVAGMAARSAGS